MTDLQTILTCITTLGVAGLLWDASRRWASRDSTLGQRIADCDGAIREQYEKFEELEALRADDAKLAVIRRDQFQVELTQITNTLSVRRTEFEALQTQVAEVPKRIAELTAELEAMHEANRLEFAAMKTAFDRTLTKEALQQAVVPRGQNARQY